MITERRWLLPCSNVKKLHNVFNNYTISYRELMHNTFESWNGRVKKNYEKELEKHILVGNQNDQFWNLSVNLDW